MKLSGQKIMRAIETLYEAHIWEFFWHNSRPCTMSKKGNDFTVIPRIAKQRNMYRTYTYGILLYYGDASF